MLAEKNTGDNTTNGFETKLTNKQKFYLYLYIMCPSIEILDILWDEYMGHALIETRKYHIQISPFKPHPCGYDSIFKPACGYIDPDMFLDYYQPRESYLSSIKLIRHPYFICKFNCTKDSLENNYNYFTNLINEPQYKVTKLQKVKILEKAIHYLQSDRYPLNLDQVMRYIMSCYNMYCNNRVLYAYPIAIDTNGELCRFE